MKSDIKMEGTSKWLVSSNEMNKKENNTRYLKDIDVIGWINIDEWISGKSDTHRTTETRKFSRSSTWHVWVAVPRIRGGGNIIEWKTYKQLQEIENCSDSSWPPAEKNKKENLW